MEQEVFQGGGGMTRHFSSLNKPFSWEMLMLFRLTQEQGQKQSTYKKVRGSTGDESERTRNVRNTREFLMKKIHSPNPIRQAEK